MPMVVSKKGKEVKLSKFNFSKDYAEVVNTLKLDDDCILELILDTVDREVWREWNRMLVRAKDAELKKLASIMCELIQSHEPA